MIYDHRVKIGGVWYKAGEDVPALNTTKTEKVEVKAEKVSAVENTVEPVEVEANPQVTVKKYSRKK